MRNDLLGSGGRSSLTAGGSSSLTTGSSSLSTSSSSSLTASSRGSIGASSLATSSSGGRLSLVVTSLQLRALLVTLLQKA